MQHFHLPSFLLCLGALVFTGCARESNPPLFMIDPALAPATQPAGTATRPSTRPSTRPGEELSAADHDGGHEGHLRADDEPEIIVLELPEAEMMDVEWSPELSDEMAEMEPWEPEIIGEAHEGLDEEAMNHMHDDELDAMSAEHDEDMIPMDPEEYEALHGETMPIGFHHHSRFRHDRHSFRNHRFHRDHRRFRGRRTFRRGFNRGNFNRGGFQRGGFNRRNFNRGGLRRGGFRRGGFRRGGFRSRGGRSRGRR